MSSYTPSGLPFESRSHRCDRHPIYEEPNRCSRCDSVRTARRLDRERGDYSRRIIEIANGDTSPRGSFSGRSSDRVRELYNERETRTDRANEDLYSRELGRSGRDLRNVLLCGSERSTRYGGSGYSSGYGPGYGSGYGSGGSSGYSSRDRERERDRDRYDSSRYSSSQDNNGSSRYSSSRDDYGSSRYSNSREDSGSRGYSSSRDAWDNQEDAPFAATHPAGTHHSLAMKDTAEEAAGELIAHKQPLIWTLTVMTATKFSTDQNTRPRVFFSLSFSHHSCLIWYYYQLPNSTYVSSFLV
jgi:hypothetical protein